MGGAHRAPAVGVGVRLLQARGRGQRAGLREAIPEDVVVHSPAVGLVRTLFVFTTLLTLRYLSKIFYRHDFAWVGDVPKHPWRNHRLVAFLNPASLFEPVFLGGVPNSFVWRIAAHGVVPAADKTTGRPLVGLLFKFVAHHVIAITRERDHTWFQVLNKVDPHSMIIILPEGRMKRANGLDLKGNPMNARGGIADILLAMKQGRMLIAYSGGLHHVQIPGHVPNVFKTVRMRLEDVDIARYIEEMMAAGGPDQFKKNVMRD